jgi:hypothetical protein
LGKLLGEKQKKKGGRINLTPSFLSVGVERFELPTPCSQSISLEDNVNSKTFASIVGIIASEKHNTGK